MNTLKQKIKNTALLAPDEKVDILAAMDGYSESDLKELEAIIDEYDAAHANIIKTFEKNVTGELDAIIAGADPSKKPQLTKAADQIRKGLSALSVH